jgi:hypothetical protein
MHWKGAPFTLRKGGKPPCTNFFKIPNNVIMKVVITPFGLLGSIKVPIIIHRRVQLL